MKNAEVLTRIRQISEAVALTHQAFLVDIKLRGQKDSQVLEVFVDTTTGITADGCAEISRDLSVRLDHENLIPGRYELRVSSPGLDRPLKLRQQYVKNVGRDLTVRYKAGEQTQTVTGQLTKVDADSIVLLLRSTEEVITIPFEDIQESRVKIDFRSASR